MAIALITVNSSSSQMEGLMDEVAIFNRALSEDEINQIMNGGLSQSVLAVGPADKLAVAWGTLKIAQ
jgi:hypothetical protein